ncbi:MAG TPA: metallophosphoesterase family protein, partial [Nitrososphaeraceae archaeon]|nr:metallophosphoesterase family protein [Nitrososphaeraceae archaeon]
MKIGIISDTHDCIGNIEKSVKIFKHNEISFVLHAGDYTNPDAVRSFQSVKLIGVLGNNDIDIDGLADAFNEIGGDLKGELYEFNEG